MKKTNIDSPFYRTMGKIGDLLFANLLWLVCCLPIVTAGASTLGLFTVVNKMAAKEDYTVHTDFFKAFKRDFKQSTALWLVLLLAGFAALTGLRTATAQDTPSTGILAAASFLLLLLAGCCGSWGFALLARFTYPGVLPVLADCPLWGIWLFWRGFLCWQKPPLRGSSICCPCGCSSAAQVLPLAWQA